MALRLSNAIYIVQGEISCLMTEMKRAMRFSNLSIYQESSPLINNFVQLRDLLHNATALEEFEPRSFLNPFLELVRSEETSGWITGLALMSLNKFIAHGFIDATNPAGAAAVEGIADAVTHARFVGVDPESDEVVLMRILQVLRCLLLSPCGRSLSNESVCEIMQSCFRICFETRLSKLLRRTADQILVEMVQLVFSRLPEFTEDSKWAKNMKKLKMQARISHKDKGRQKNRSESTSSANSSTTSNFNEECNATDEQNDRLSAENGVDNSLHITTNTDSELISSDTTKSHADEAGSDSVSDPGHDPGNDHSNSHINGLLREDKNDNDEGDEKTTHMVDIHEGLPSVGQEDPSDLGQESDIGSDAVSEPDLNADTVDFINPRGIRFIPKKQGPTLPYGLAAIRELFRFLISIMNPSDKQNNEEMSHMGIYLLTVALETAVDHLPRYSSLMSLVKNELCFNLFRQLQTERISLFAAAMRACFLLFESLRSHLKFQLESYLTRLMDIIISDSPRITFDIKETALQGLVQLWRIPGLVTELYLNYDCDVHCSNLFEDITKLLSKNAFPVTGLYTTHILSLDSLLTVLDTVEAHCHSRIMAAKNVPERPASTTGGSWRKPQIKPNRMLSQTVDMPSLEQLHSRKHQKQIYYQAVELFNQKPKHGIAYLQEQGYLRKNNQDIVAFLKETPKLNKALIGEYISRKDNPELTMTYMRSFNFSGKRIDEALRMLLETFRLPGESPVIEYLMEHFSNLWFESNNSPFADVDAAFTLVYAVIMLNVDQHNHNAKKQNEPMTVQQFRKNLKGVNGGSDFDQGMLEEIFNAIHKEEIVLPEERTGLVKDIYIWKVLLSKESESKSNFIHAPTGFYDNEIFAIIWGPTIAALSFVFDKSQDQKIVQKAITGYKKCAMISAHYGLSEVFDNLVISLCKFTTLLNNPETSEQIPLSFAANQKAQLAAKTVFNLAHRHGDMLREGWKNILDCMMTLYRARLLPQTFTDVEDFLHPDGRITLIKESKTSDSRNETGVFNAFLTYFASEGANQKGLSAEELQARETSKQVIEECELDAVIDDTKFLRTSSLQELVKALISLCQINDADSDTYHDEELVVFFLELLIRVVLQNRDRAGVIWQNVRDHLSSLILGSVEHTLLAERAVTGLLRLSIRLLCREEVATQVLPSLRVLLLMKPTVLQSMCRQLAFGLHLLLETNAANIHSTEDWYCLFTLLEVVGAGGSVPKQDEDERPQDLTENDAQSDGEPASLQAMAADVERGYTSDSELYDHSSVTSAGLATASSSGDVSEVAATDNSSWILVNKNTNKNLSLDKLPLSRTKSHRPLANQFSICLDEQLQPHDSKSLMKCSEILSLLVRDAAHITPYNFDSCIHAIRVFVEASMKGTVAIAGAKTKQNNKHKEKKHKKKDHHTHNKMSRSHTTPSRLTHSLGDISDDETETSATEYKALSLQLLELMHTLHTRAASIFQSWAEEQPEDDKNGVCDAESSSLWRRCWCPLLQGMARLCTDSRIDVRWHALRDLQRALLVQELNELSAVDWEACFNKVLFPLLSVLLEKSPNMDPTGIEETRFRASTLLSKVYLQHLSVLLSLSTFTALWLTILDFMDKYMHADYSGQLTEGIPELLKNMLLVMNGTQLFYDKDDPRSETQLCKLTCDKLSSFLPSLKQELFTVPELPASTNLPSPRDSEGDSTNSGETLPVQDSTKAASAAATITAAAAAVPDVNNVSRPVSPPVSPPISPPVNTVSPTSPMYSPAKPHLNARSSSPLVHSLPSTPVTIQLHPPLAAPHYAPPTLLPVSQGYNSLPAASSFFSQGQMTQQQTAAGTSLLFGPLVTQKTTASWYDTVLLQSNDQSLRLKSFRLAFELL